MIRYRPSNKQTAVNGHINTRTKIRKNKLKYFFFIFACTLIGSSLTTPGSTQTQMTSCKFEGSPAATCEIIHLHIKSGWKEEILIEANGTKRRISREMRGNEVQITLHAPGQAKESFHSGTYIVNGEKFKVSTQDGGSYVSRGNQIIIHVDGGSFSYSL